MNPEDEPTSFERFVLVALAELDARGATPAFDYEVRKRCERRLEAVTDPFGRATRCEVIRALTALEAAGWVRERTPPNGDRGMGRPTYALAVPHERVWELAEGDPQLDQLVGPQVV